MIETIERRVIERDYGDALVQSKVSGDEMLPADD
jgi:hypothetical protein